MQFQRQDNHVQQGVGGGEGHQPRPKASGKSLKKPDRPGLGMDIKEGEWGIFEDYWARDKRMTSLTDLEGVSDEVMECCTKQLNTHMVQMHGLWWLGIL